MTQLTQTPITTFSMEAQSYVGRLNQIYEMMKEKGIVSLDICEFFDEFSDYDISKPELKQSSLIQSQLTHLKQAVERWGVETPGKFPGLQPHYFPGNPSMMIAPFIGLDIGSSRKYIGSISRNTGDKAVAALENTK